MNYLPMQSVQQKIYQATQRFIESEKCLFVVNASERSFTYHIAKYIEQEFQGWHVDCEYNRMGMKTKKVSSCWFSNNTTRKSEKIVVPDIIVHRRNTEENLIAFEIKTSAVTLSGKKIDLQKLKAYANELHYCYVVLLIIDIVEKKITFDFVD